MPLFLAFLLVPIIEIALFIQVGSFIGLLPTLGIVILTAVLGTWLVKTQGRLALGQLRGSFEHLSDPTEPLAHGAMILLAGALLLTPGFFTDAFGFLLLVPGFRTKAFSYVRSKVAVTSFRMGGAQGPSHPRQNAGDDIIDGDFEDVTSPSSTGRSSGWVEGPK
ncbi:FxsA family protein [Phaeobacter sp. B1627]|uniref:FxsA family protein n=1 Tax=Phaeobacter sp. B1627 TaxID=2583809 RepID=UPI0011180AAC|nr:FxsA family protein [Phaeobacter sp. B1627]TNJ45519.1 FxsA family protein [Phaeobacter sp. B1627]